MSVTRSDDARAAEAERRLAHAMATDIEVIASATRAAGFADGRTEEFDRLVSAFLERYGGWAAERLLDRLRKEGDEVSWFCRVSLARTSANSQTRSA